MLGLISVDGTVMLTFDRRSRIFWPAVAVTSEDWTWD